MLHPKAPRKRGAKRGGAGAGSPKDVDPWHADGVSVFLVRVKAALCGAGPERAAALAAATTCPVIAVRPKPSRSSA